MSSAPAMLSLSSEIEGAFAEVSKVIADGDPWLEDSLRALDDSIPKDVRCTQTYRAALGRLRYHVLEIEQQRNQLLTGRAQEIIAQLELMASIAGLRSAIAIFWRQRNDANWWEAKRKELLSWLRAGQMSMALLEEERRLCAKPSSFRGLVDVPEL